MAVAVVVGVVLSAMAYVLARRSDDERVQTALELRAEWRARDFERKLTLSAYPVQILAPLIAAQDDFNPGVFYRFVRLAHGVDDVADGLSWAPLVNADDRDAFVAGARRAGATGYDIVERDANGKTVPALPRDRYLPIYLDENFGLATPLGLDILATPTRRALADAARDSGVPTGLPYPPVRGTAAYAYLVFAPVYAGGGVPTTLAQRRADFRGMAVGRFTVATLLAAATIGTPSIIERIDFLTATGAGAPPTAIAHYDPVTKRFTAPLAVAPASDDITITRNFELLGQTWTLVSYFSAASAADLRSTGPYAWLAMGLLLTGLVASYLALERGRRFGVEATVVRRTAELAVVSDERRRVEQQLVQAQKMEAIGNLTGGLAHDFNNLLGVIIGNLDLLRANPHNANEVNEFSADALDAALRGADLTRRLLAFARRQPLQPERVDIDKLVTGMAKLLGRTLGEQVEIELELAPDIWPVVADPAQLEASLANLATNARDAMPQGGKVEIVTANRRLDADYASSHPDVKPGDYAMIEVSDTGTGMSEDTMTKIFEPFFTTKEPGKGTGLGLSMVFGFMKQSGGHINVYSEPGFGTSFRLYLPRATTVETVADLPDPAAVAMARGEIVLVVEDNDALRRVVLRQLQELGYRTLEAENASVALAVLAREGADMLLTDIVMNGEADGYALAAQVQRQWPAMKILLTSGFPQGKLNGNGNGHANGHGNGNGHSDPGRGFRLLNKPYRRDELARTVRETLDGV